MMNVDLGESWEERMVSHPNTDLYNTDLFAGYHGNPKKLTVNHTMIFPIKNAIRILPFSDRSHICDEWFLTIFMSLPWEWVRNPQVTEEYPCMSFE